MKRNRETLLGASLLILATILMIGVALHQTAGQMPPYTSLSAAPNGTLALKMWMGRLGYAVIDEIPAEFQLPAQTALVFMIEPGNFQEPDFDRLDQWVSDGGTLIAAGHMSGMSELARHYEFRMKYLEKIADQALPQVPMLLSPPLDLPAPVGAGLGYTSERRDFVTLVGSQGQPLVVMFDSGDGRVILSTSAYPFTNLGLKADGNPQLVLNLVAAAARRGQIWFDEWHHGLRGQLEIVGPDRWLRYTPAGHALLFAAAVIFLALIFQGRTFGRPVPLEREIKRRRPIEYLTAIANLNRRAGHRQAVLDRYHRQVKRRLGRRYRLDPGLPDEEFVRLLTRYNPGLDGAGLLSLLRHLSVARPGEAELVRLADEAARWLKE